MLKSGRYWIRFVLATRDHAVLVGSPPPPLFVLFSHPDMLSSENPQRLARDVYACLQDEFSNYFEWIDGNPFISNCRVRSTDINRLLRAFDVAHDKVTKVRKLFLKYPQAEHCTNSKLSLSLNSMVTLEMKIATLLSLQFGPYSSNFLPLRVYIFRKP